MTNQPDPLSVIVEATALDFPSAPLTSASKYPLVKTERKKDNYVKNGPQKERAEHKQMYSFYEKLGHKRSLRRVAREFGRSFGTVALISRSFGWIDRIKQTEALMKDPVVNVSQPKMDGARLDIIGVVSEITMILAGMTELSRSIRKGIKEELNSSEKAKMKSLINALAVYGIKIRTPKDLRDMVGTLKDVMDFHKGAPTAIDTPNQNTQVNVKEFNLLIKDD
jgi:hypothetical protein